jgi:Uma2 family endonuclease
LPAAYGIDILGLMSRSASPSPLLTAADVERLSLPDKQVELVRGRLVVREPPGALHGAMAATLTHFLTAFVRERHLGTVFAQDTGFHIAHDPDTVRAPDVAFVSRDRLAQIPPRGYAPVAPDLAVEILSPGDRPAETLAKLADWLAAGSRLVWLVDPQRAEVQVYRKDGSLSVHELDGTLDGEDVLPGFTCSVRQLFE